VAFEIGDRTQRTGADTPVRLGVVEIRANRAGVGRVSIGGGGPRPVGFLPHIDLPRFSRNQKSGFPLRGTAEQECPVEWHQHRSRPSGRFGADIRWFIRTVVQASGKERMSLKKVVFRLGEQRKSARSSE
jgi:hypothetical protein